MDPRHRAWNDNGGGIDKVRPPVQRNFEQTSRYFTPSFCVTLSMTGEESGALPLHLRHPSTDVTLMNIRAKESISAGGF